jgi:hypothetical protein
LNHWTVLDYWPAQKGWKSGFGVISARHNALWLGYDGRAGEHWFGVGAEPELCRCCWETARCPQQFAHKPGEHETLLGRLAQQVLQQVRPWIEPAQSFEKHQPGLGDLFFNSLRFTWAMALLADAATKASSNFIGDGFGSGIASSMP